MTVNRLAESLRLAIAWAYIAIMGAMVSLAPVSAQALIQPVPNAVMSVAGNTPDASGNVTLPTTFSGIAMYNSTINGAPMASTADVANAVVGLDALSARQAAISGLSAVYQPVGSYLTPTALTPYLTSSAAASTYETPSQTAALYQPLGSYLTSGALAPYPTTTQMNAAIAAAIPAPYAFSVGATPNARALALATAYQCTNAAKPCIVYASITTTTSLTLGTGTTNTQNIIVGTTKQRWLLERDRC